MEKSRLYIVELFRQNKLAACLVSVFFLLNFAANFLVPTQLTPIYNWNLYAQPVAPQKTYQFLDIRYNNSIALDLERTWREPQRLILTNTMAAYVHLQIDSMPDWIRTHFDSNWKAAHPRFMKSFPNFKNYYADQELKRFPAWFHSYLQTYTGLPIDSIRVYRRVLSFDQGGNVRERSSQLIYSYP